MQRHQVAINQPVQTNQIFEIDTKLEKQPEKTEALPTFEEAIAPNQKSQTRLPQGQLYTSEKNKFSVMLPPDTKVSESDEVGYTITYFNLKESVQTIEIRSYDGDVNGGNLNDMIASGNIGHLLTGGFKSENRVKCSETGALCFLSKLYSQPSPEYSEPRLMILVEHVISQSEFPKFYDISIGAHHPALSDKDLTLFSMIHDSFRLDR